MVDVNVHKIHIYHKIHVKIIHHAKMAKLGIIIDVWIYNVKLDIIGMVIYV